MSRGCDEENRSGSQLELHDGGAHSLSYKTSDGDCGSSSGKQRWHRARGSAAPLHDRCRSDMDTT